MDWTRVRNQKEGNNQMRLNKGRRDRKARENETARSRAKQKARGAAVQNTRRVEGAAVCALRTSHAEFSWLVSETRAQRKNLFAAFIALGSTGFVADFDVFGSDVVIAEVIGLPADKLVVTRHFCTRSAAARRASVRPHERLQGLHAWISFNNIRSLAIQSRCICRRRGVM